MKLNVLAITGLGAMMLMGCSHKEYATVQAGNTTVKSSFITYDTRGGSKSGGSGSNSGYVEYKPNKGGKSNDGKGSGSTTGTSSQLSSVSKKLGVTVTKSDNYKLYNEVAGWIGVRYRYGGTTKSGVDCSGFTGNIYQAVYSITLTRNSSGMLSNDCRKVSKGNLQEGDLVFFRTDGKNTSTPNHVGVYLKNNMFAHASTSNGVVVSSLDSDYYRKTFLTGGRVSAGTKRAMPGAAPKKSIEEAEEGELMIFALEEDGDVEE